MIELQLTPLNGIECQKVDASAKVDVRATGSDPQFAVTVKDGLTIGAGWYELAMEIEIGKRRLVDPVLYPDYGAGMGEETRIPVDLRSIRGGVAKTIINFSSAVKALRFDPSIGPCDFSHGRISLRPVGRIHAAKVMARMVVASSKGRRAKARFAAALAHSAISGGSGGVGRLLRHRYEALALHNETDYDSWVALYGALNPPAKGEIEAWKSRPLFSVVMPTYNTPEKWLRKCIMSVVEQSYPHWELCIADDCSPKPEVMRVLREFEARDPRIKVVRRQENGHISASSNDALKLASGDYIVLLDHDDELHPHALYEMAKGFLANPSWKMAFSDEDKIDDKGRRFDPYFKADWNYDLFLAHNCISHLGVYSRDLVESVGGFRLGYEGSQDWDLALRCIETLKQHEIGHVAHVLYHWRAIPGSTAFGPGEKTYAHFAAMKSIQSHLDRIGRDAEVLDIPNFSGNYRVRYRLPAVVPKVSLIIPTKDRADLLSVAVKSIQGKTTYPNYEIIIVDNQSVEVATHDLFAELDTYPNIRVLKYDRPFNYSAINNFAVEAAEGTIIGLLNNDIEVISPDWLDEMVSHSLRPDVGAVGAMLYFPDDTIQHAGVVLGFNGIGVHAFAERPRGWVGMMLRARLLQNYSAVTAACLVIRKEVYQQVGGLDEGLAVAYNDVDFCLRVKAAGYRNLWTPYAELYHHESASRGSDMDETKRVRFDKEVALMKSRWASVVQADPAYSPNLASGGQTFDLAFPPRHAVS